MMSRLSGERLWVRCLLTYSIMKDDLFSLEEVSNGKKAKQIKDET